MATEKAVQNPFCHGLGVILVNGFDVYCALHWQLDNANQAIAARKEQGEDVAVLNQKLRMEMEMRVDEQRRCADAMKNVSILLHN